MPKLTARRLCLNALCLALLLCPSIPLAAHGPSIAPTEGGGIVRIGTIAPDDVSELRQRVDVWGIQRPSDQPNRDLDAASEASHSEFVEGFTIAWATAEQAQALREAGFAVEADPEATARYLEPPTATEGGGIPGFPCYRTVEETFGDLAQLAHDHPDLAQWVDLGDSWEKINGPGSGFDIHALVLTHQATPGPKPPLMIIAAMHAREYTTAETLTRFAEDLVTSYGTDPEATWLLDHVAVHLIPQLNPDGRTQAETGIFWRNNVNNDFCANSDLRGIDLNRNSSFLWGDSGGSSGSSCSETFRGPTPASEPETLAIESYMAQVFDDQRGPNMDDPAPDSTEGVFISIHSFSELVLYPWEATSTDAPNAAQLRTLGRKFGFYTDYAVCQDCLGTASGATVDEAYGEYGVAGYTFELGTNFFQSCNFFESDILPRVMPALRYAVKAARRPYQGPAGPEILDPQVSADSVAAGTPVTLSATADDSRFDSNGFGNEPVQNVVAVSYSIDLPPWQATSLESLSAVDGSFDSLSEDATATVDTAGLAPGRHLIYVVAEDAEGNVGVPSAVFLTIEGDDTPLFRDGFESGDLSVWSGGS